MTHSSVLLAYVFLLEDSRELESKMRLALQAMLVAHLASL